MLGLLRVFLDPEIYGPGPEARGRGNYTSAGYTDTIPEPVPFEPPPESAPAWAPAAHMEGVQEGHPNSQYDYDIYSEAYAEPYREEPAFATGTYDSFAAPPVPIETIPGANVEEASAGGTTAQPYPTASPPPVSAPTQYGGPNADIPVLGKTTPDMT